MKKFAAYLAAAIFCVLGGAVKAQAQAVPFDSDRWEIDAKESKVVDYLGRKSLYLKTGVAIVKNSQFTDGVIEYDIAFTDAQGFMGAFWRMQDAGNYEEFYVRPHQSGQPDANQYQPVFNGVAAWQLYYGAGYAAAIKYDFNQWVHVKIVVSGKQAEVYIKDMETPLLFVSEQKREIKQGRVGVSVGNFAPAYYSNYSFTPMSNPPLKGTAKAPEPTPPGMIMSWQISSPVEGKSLEAKYQLTEADKRKLSWRKFSSESTGVANLARLQGIKDGHNTVFARLVIQSDREQVKKIRFGFSDEVRAYFNDRLIYGGSDIWRSRDHRFLGTVSLSDDLYLPLKKGDNELWLAITENFGGWGVKALIEDRSGISIKE